MKFIHLTDPHLVAPGDTLFGLDPAARLARACESIERNHRDAAFCVITGDLVHWGDAPSYALLRETLADLRIDVHLLIGNHDDRHTFRQSFPDLPVDYDGFIQQVVETEAGVFLLLDTVLEGTHAGHLSTARLTWVERALAASMGKSVFLFMHHGPVACGIPSLDSIQLQQKDALGDLLEDHGQVRHIFFGHLHRPVHGSWRGIPFSTLRATSHQVAPTFEGAGGGDQSKMSITEPPEYAVVFIDDEAVVVHTHAFLDEGDWLENLPDPRLR